MGITIVFSKGDALATTSCTDSGKSSSLRASAVAEDVSTDTGSNSLSDVCDDGVSEVDPADFEFLREVAATNAFGESVLQPQDGETHVPIASANELADDMVYIIDSGADLDVINLKKAMRKVKSCTRSIT